MGKCRFRKCGKENETLKINIEEEMEKKIYRGKNMCEDSLMIEHMN